MDSCFFFFKTKILGENQGIRMRNKKPVEGGWVSEREERGEWLTEERGKTERKSWRVNINV